jgi:hypothetical protein
MMAYDGSIPIRTFGGQLRMFLDLDPPTLVFRQMPMQGVDLEGETNKDRGQKEWEDMKARVFSRGQTSDSNDILSLQGPAAKKAGFGIGMGIEYEKI